MPQPFLIAEHICKQFAHHTALHDVSISVPEGRVFGLLGPNGAGKTTLIRIINRITLPDSGQVSFDGHPLEADDVRQIGYLPEERGLYKKMKVGEQALYLAQLKGMSNLQARAALQEWFERFGIMSWWDKKLEELSKGMQQKVQFIITVLHRPRLLIFDEPFSGFDPVNAEQLKREILRLRNEGHTVIFSTHNMASVEEICDEMALINHGQVVLSGNVGEVKRSFSTGDYEVTCTDDTLQPEGNAAFEVIEKTAMPDATRYLLRKRPEVSVRDFICQLAQQAEFKSFSEKLPTMHEIFLKSVAQ